MSRATEPENLYPEFRISFTNQLTPLFKQGLSFKIEGPSGVGKSKYLRFLCNSKTMAKKFFTSPSVKLIYGDLNLVFQTSTEYLMYYLCDLIGAEEQSTRSLDKKIMELLKEYDRIYFVLDHAELLSNFDESAARYIRGIRDQHKYQLGIVLSYETGANFNHEKLQSINDISTLTLQMGPLDENEIAMNVKYFSEQQGLKLTAEEIKRISKATKGYPKFIRQILSEIIAGRSIDEALLITDIGMGDVETSEPDVIIDRAIKALTKSEFLVFKEVYSHKTKVVTRDQLAEILNPESGGVGVSNESIDQIVSRVRKALKRANIKIDIRTKRGLGYYI